MVPLRFPMYFGTYCCPLRWYLSSAWNSFSFIFWLHHWWMCACQCSATKYQKQQWQMQKTTEALASLSLCLEQRARVYQQSSNTMNITVWCLTEIPHFHQNLKKYNNSNKIHPVNRYFYTKHQQTHRNVYQNCKQKHRKLVTMCSALLHFASLASPHTTILEIFNIIYSIKYGFQIDYRIVFVYVCDVWVLVWAVCLDTLLN